jgi:hypothetical protein
MADEFRPLQHLAHLVFHGAAAGETTMKALTRTFVARTMVGTRGVNPGLHLVHRHLRRIRVRWQRIQPGDQRSTPPGLGEST